MKLDELRTVQSKERRKDSLQQLRDSFYEDVAAYIQDLKASRDRRAEQVDDPFSDDEVRRLSDELETAEEVAEAVYERRVGKVVKLASFAAADMPVDDEGMTSEEQRLFDDLVDRISQNKTTVLDVIAGNTDSDEAPESAGEPASTPTATGESASTPIATDEPASTPIPEPTEAAESEPSAPSADNMLADAMGSGSGSTADPLTESPAESVAGSTGDPTAESTADATTESTANESVTPDRATPSENQLPDDVPPPEPDSESDPVLETTTDGGTAADTAAASAAAKSTESTPETGVETSTPAGESADDGASDDDRTTVRITRDVGEIFGVDGREYTLRSEDVVTLPTANADPLVDRDAAMRLE